MELAVLIIGDDDDARLHRRSFIGIGLIGLDIFLIPGSHLLIHSTLNNSIVDIWKKIVNKKKNQSIFIIQMDQLRFNSFYIMHFWT